ncbi:MAG: hypothetical protein R3E10_10155 [Gemmatimonadota bacterium]
MGRDFLVLLAHKAALQHLGRRVPPAIDLLLEREFEPVPLGEDEDLVPVPYYEIAEGGENDPAAYRLIDPPFTGPVIPYPQLIERQFEFLFRLATSALGEVGPAIGGLSAVLATAVLQHRVDRGYTSARVLADLLHQHRWAAGASMAAELFHEAMLGSGLDGKQAQATLLAQAANPRFIEARVKAVRTHFEEANQGATSLDDWAERLYRLRPHLEEMTLYLRWSELEGTDRRLGLVLHLMSLTDGRLHDLAAFAERQLLSPAEAPVLFDGSLEKVRLTEGPAALRQALEQDYHHERRIPRFWYEAALGALETPPDQWPAPLRAIDLYRVLSIRCLEEWSTAWDGRASEAIIEDPEAGLPKDLAASLNRGSRPIGALDRDPGPLPERTRILRRDHEIVRVGVERFSLPGLKEVPWLWTAIADQAPPPLEVLPFEDEFVSVPRVHGFRAIEQALSEASAIDPPWTGDTWPYFKTLRLQTDFLRIMATCPGTGGQLEEDQDHAFKTLSRLVWEEGEEHGSAYARALVDRWHAHRWAPGTQLAGLLLYQTVQDPNHESSVRTEERIKIENNGTLINARIQGLQARMQAIKESVTTLTDWTEALYRISPYLHELRIMLDRSEGASAEAWLKRFQDTGDQIIDVGTLNLGTVLSMLTGRSDAPTWTTKWLRDIRTEEGSVSQTWKRLDHLYREQVTFPKFWYELAVQHVDTPLEKMPAALTALDAFRAISIDVLECWSAQLINAPRNPDTEDG